MPLLLVSVDRWVDHLANNKYIENQFSRASQDVMVVMSRLDRASRDALGAEGVKARIIFAKAHLEHDTQFWKSVLWLDETQLQLYGHHDVAFAWRIKIEMPSTLGIPSRHLRIQL